VLNRELQSCFGNDLILGGEFRTAGGAPRNRIAAVDATTGAVTVWNPGTDGFVNAVAVAGNVVGVGGDHSSAGGLPRTNAAALDATTGIATSFDPNTNGVGPAAPPSARAARLTTYVPSWHCLDRRSPRSLGSATRDGESRRALTSTPPVCITSPRSCPAFLVDRVA
jgi:hypothetical protein